MYYKLVFAKPGMLHFLKIELCYHSNPCHETTMQPHPLLCLIGIMKMTLDDIPALEPA